MADETEADIEASLREQGAQADAMGEQAESQPAPAESTNPSTETEGESQSPAVKENKPEVQSAETTSEKPLSEYQRIKQEKRDREAEAWKKIESEKQRLSDERKQWEEQRSKASSERDQLGYTLSDYEKCIKDSEAESKELEMLDPQAAQEKAKLAEWAKGQAEKLGLESKKRAWASNFSETTKELGVHDELKDPASESGQKFKALLDSAPAVFYGSPEGAKVAAQLYVAQKEAAAASALKPQVEALTKENQRLTKLTSLPRSGPAKGANDIGEKDLTESDLRRMASEFDNELI